MSNMQANTVGNNEHGLLKDIYIIKNSINDKVYIGQSVNAEERFQQHCKKCSAEGSIISRAIQSYGKDIFWYEILESQIPNYNEREEYWINYYNSLIPNGYNIAKGGEEPPHFYGVNHPLSTLSKEDVRLIKIDLKETQMSFSEIAQKYGSSKRTIMRINQGIHYEEIDEEYPIRKNSNLTGVLTEEQVDDIIEILKYSYRQGADIGKQFGVCEKAIRDINAGNTHKREDEDYPIRKYKNSGKPACTYDQVTQITDLLVNTNISCQKIAKIFHVRPAEIYLINSGKSKRYYRNEYKYPLRKHNPVR